MTIFQPRREHVSTFTISKEALLSWAEETLAPTAQLASKGEGEYKAGSHCQFCKVKAICRKRAEYNLELACYDFEMPESLEDDEIEVILAKADELVSWVGDIKEYALQQAVSGKEWKDWKLVEGRSNRKYVNDKAVADKVESAGYDPYSMSTLDGQSVNTMDALSDLAKEMGSKTAFSASECAEALNYLALAGYDTQEMADTLPTVLNLAAAGGLDLASASDMVTDAMSALGMETSEADTMVDQMAKTASSTNTSVGQLGEGILTIGATAKSVKGGTAELNTALGILANNGIKGAEGGTHLRNVILSLQNPTDGARKTMESLGVSVYDSEGNMRNDDKNYIVSEDAYKQFGWVCAVEHWNDVNVPSNLIKKGAEWIKSNQFENITLKLKAVDLSLMNASYESISLGDKVRCIAKPYGMDRLFPVLKLSIPLSKSAETSFELGETKQKGYIEQISKSYQSLAEETEQNRKVTNARIKDAVDNLTESTSSR